MKTSVLLLAVAVPLAFAAGCSGKAASGAKLVQLKGDRIELGDKVHFQTGKADLDPKSSELLDAVADLISTQSVVGRVRIEGHTDNVGDPAFDKQLSEDRAKAVKGYLTGKGIAAERLDAAGFGDEKPVAANDIEDGRARNRRVEFLIVK